MASTYHAHKNKLLNWQPGASIETLRKRAALLAEIRRFFQKRNVLELETPCLSRHSVSDPFLDPLTVIRSESEQAETKENKTFYLQTSPEYAMKRMLAAGFSDIFQISKCFRDDEIGRYHNPEFTMLEWYRSGFDMQALIDEVVELLRLCLKTDSHQQVTYTQLFQTHFELEPNRASLKTLLDLCCADNIRDYAKLIYQDSTCGKLSKEAAKDGLLQLLFNTYIEPYIGAEAPCIVTHFPASQAALAKLDDSGQFGLRFEVYYKQIELANGFEELTCAKTQRMRFEKDNELRRQLGKPQRDLDERFLAALEHGLPSCAGVALGMDRLIMLSLGKSHIQEVLTFDFNQA
uniref:elongation factor P--(R)-beta-lysine ligase n=1 Tax=Ningiella ruwaisensis TaxID=2364274 RepID=UPI0010A07D55|nr:elongation factor P--(R)-beta-lysine ligase [Ningiella ruwaisensis]